MPEYAAPRAGRICARLYAVLCAGELRGHVLAAFSHAISVGTDEGLISLLAGGRTLAPDAIQLEAEIPSPQRGWERGASLWLDVDGAYVGAGKPLFSLLGAEMVDLCVYRRLQAMGRPPRPLSAAPVIDWLSRHRDAAGLSVLITRQGDNPYAALIGPRLPALLEAVAGGDAARAAEAAAAIAGCGPGLTPSSDDLLAGYMAMLHALAAGGYGSEMLTMTHGIAAGAAKRTNRIAGAFLLQCGDGYVSEDVLALLDALLWDAGGDGLKNALDRVGAIGSTSGADMLTGIALAIISFREGSLW